MTDNYDNHAQKSRDLTAELLGRAPPRPRPRKEAEDAAFSALHVQWQRNLCTTKRSRYWAPVGLAASLIMAVAVFLVYSGPESGPTDTIIASIVRVSGDEASIRLKGGEETPIIIGTEVGRGAVISTGPETRLALDWMPGISLRFDEKTTVEIVSNTEVQLLAGAVYFDSKPAIVGGTRNSSFIVATTHGIVRHIGTQYMVRLEKATTAISVRKGRVRFDGAGTDVLVESGHQIRVDTSGLLSKDEIVSHDGVWRWAEDIAPSFLVNGRSAADVLEWVARETGRQLIYHAQSRQVASQAVIHGIDNVAPNSALNALVVATDLNIEFVDGTIEVRENLR